ncbi:MAG: hypothetical protein J1F64_05310 [Oscillospiraceae bacterium]|nr:hypothetical protein [Oscillospiraceae bacterium]
MKSNQYNFHHNWSFKSADTFPMQNALDKCRDKNGHYFYEPEYEEKDWQSVDLPHTFNDADLFSQRARDSGGSQKRTAAFYRACLEIPEEYHGHKVLFESEGIRQTCYLYVNGRLAGYYEAGVAPFGFDITEFIDYGSKNLIAVATDNTCTRDIPFCIAETPNKEDVIPGTYLLSQEQKAECEGVGYFWNCNDFNPSVGGITRPIKIHFKPKTYLTLPIYSNFRTKGTYIYGTDFDLQKGTVKVAVEAEVRNETNKDAEMYISVRIKDAGGNTAAEFNSPVSVIRGTGECGTPRSIIPDDAYEKEILPDGHIHYIPVNDETKPAPTVTDSHNTAVIRAVSENLRLDFWSINDPVLYTVDVTLFVNGCETDGTVIETGFRSVDYDPERGILINGEPVWLRGYAQRASNEWAAIGIAPQWLKDYDAELIRKSNANHIRFMHVAGSPGDIRAFDRYGIVCAQPAGDKERENFGRQWDQRVELMRDIIISFRNHPSILFWEAGNNSINREHMREMRLLKEGLDKNGGRFMGCRTLNTVDVIDESEYVGTMLNRHASKYTAKHGPVTETEYLREEAPRRIWDDFSPPDFDYPNKWVGFGGGKRSGFDFYDLTSEDFALAGAVGYSEFFNDRIGGASGKNYYSGCAALCWTDSAQHGRQAYSENGRMSGRVDAARNKKQSFDVFRVMQSASPVIKILGHWNYPAITGENYRYNIKKFNGEFWKNTGETGIRDAKNKTVYVAASYGVKSVELYINGRFIAKKEKPHNTFIFAFENIDITENGSINAKAYDYDDKLVFEDKIVTASSPAKLKLVPHTAPGGFSADGSDVMFIDIEVLDKDGNICPLCYDRIDFTLEGCGVFLGGYNSGKFDFEDKRESVIHKDHIFAECGTNRVFVRSLKTAGKINITADMNGISARCSFESKNANVDTLTECIAERWYLEPENLSDNAYIPPIADADKIKYEPEKEPYIKILVNGQEPDTRGVRSLNKNGAIWGAVICVLNRLKSEHNGFDFNYDEKTKTLTLTSGKYEVEVRAGHTHILVNGEENLTDGEPYVTASNVFVMEVSAIMPYIDGITAYYDDMVDVFRIETKK